MGLLPATRRSSSRRRILRSADLHHRCQQYEAAQRMALESGDNPPQRRDLKSASGRARDIFTTSYGIIPLNESPVHRSRSYDMGYCGRRRHPPVYQFWILLPSKRPVFEKQASMFYHRNKHVSRHHPAGGRCPSSNLDRPRGPQPILDGEAPYHTDDASLANSHGNHCSPLRILSVACGAIPTLTGYLAQHWPDMGHAIHRKS